MSSMFLPNSIEINPHKRADIFRQGSRDTNFAALQGSNGKKTQEEINDMKLNVLLGDAYKEGMTADEIISALEKVADPNAEVEKLRNAVTKANGEAAEYKKQLKAKRTDDENAAQEQADKLAEMQKQIEDLTADKENLVKEKPLHLTVKSSLRRVMTLNWLARLHLHWLTATWTRCLSSSRSL